jgi:homoserine dehydrogenase
MGSALGALVADGPLPVELARVGLRHPARARAAPLPSGAIAGSVEELLGDDSLDAVVELTGGIDEPLAWARTTLGAGCAYVTGNKALLATHGGELAALARGSGAALLGSASVGGGTPMIETVQHLATAGGIGRLRGLLNATTTFILAAMAGGHGYDDALAEAQRAGYAEPDPTFDVTGRDAAQKIAILASLAWARWLPEQEVATRGIVGIRVEPGETRRLVAEADEQGVRVGPMALGADDPMAGVSGIECLLEVQLREGAVFRLSGPGAGGPVSVRATYADLARLLAGERPILFTPGPPA